MAPPSSAARPFEIGVVSDTHGFMRPAALEALRGVDCILHAGDVGGPEVLEALERIAPVHAVRGNIDSEAWAAELPERLELQLGGLGVLVVHDRAELFRAPPPHGAALIVVGHSHRPEIGELAGALLVNPGSAGPRRFNLPISLARVTITAGRALAQLVELDA